MSLGPGQLRERPLTKCSIAQLSRTGRRLPCRELSSFPPDNHRPADGPLSLGLIRPPAWYRTVHHPWRCSSFNRWQEVAIFWRTATQLQRRTIPALVRPARTPISLETAKRARLSTQYVPPDRFQDWRILPVMPFGVTRRAVRRPCLPA